MAEQKPPPPKNRFNSTNKNKEEMEQVKENKRFPLGLLEQRKANDCTNESKEEMEQMKENKRSSMSLSEQTNTAKGNRKQINENVFNRGVNQ